MSGDRSQPDFEEDVLARFLRDLEAAPDRSAVVRDYGGRYPPMADELARLEEMNRLVARAGSDESGGDAPRQLGEFRIVRRIARGGMGDIYEAVQDRLNRRVAVKTIRRGRISPQARGRFFREQRVLARLHQTHIVPIHTAGEDGDLLYFAMPFIDGAALHHVVQAAAAFETRGPGSKTPSLAKLADRVTDDRSVSESPAPASERPRTLSADYFRSVAQVIADAAEAVDHAHRMNILHRDLKPSNILIDRNGQCWIIDFGLAGYVGQISAPIGEVANEDSSEALTTGGIIGTPQYMAPEQWRGEPADVRTDVWGLGATLYELLTLRRPFDGPSDLDMHDHVLADEPPPPRTLVRNVPADLAAVCRKAMQKNASQRYPSAQAVADDLRRWLRHEPVGARPARAVRRTALWARRNRGWAAAMVFTLLAAMALMGLEVWHERQQAASNLRDTEMLKLQRLRLESHADGWRDRCWEAAQKIHSLRSAADVKNEAAALLIGYDAHPDPALAFSFGGSSVTFDPSGKRLLVGGLKNRLGEPESGARLIDISQGGVVAVSELKGAGPVAFRHDGTPYQLAPKPKDAWTLMLWDVNRQQAVREFAIAAGLTPQPVTEFNFPVLAMAADGSRVAASTTLPNEQGTLVIWDTNTGKELGRWDRKAECLAFTPDGALLAAGDVTGYISVYALDSDSPPATWQAGRIKIMGLAFGLDPLHHDDDSRLIWQLATGDAGTRATVWDLHTRQPRCYCDGSKDSVSALAFSPDGMTLASSGRSPIKVWDAASGRLLFDIGVPDLTAGLAFDATGRRLAFCNGPSAINSVGVWELEPGRGTTTLGGLVGPVVKSTFSVDGRYFAALSQQWQIAVWDLNQGRLMHVLDGPHGEYSDNAALAFSADGTQLASAAFKEAKLWDVITGRQLHKHWVLPPGLQDALAFDPSGKKLWSVRCETTTGVPPYSHADVHLHPRVYRIRNLLDPDAAMRTIQTEPPDDHVQMITAATDASAVVINGFRIVDGQKHNTVRAFAVPECTLLWADTSTPNASIMEPTNRLLGYQSRDKGDVVVHMSSGAIWREKPGRFGPDGKWWLVGSLLSTGDTEIANLDFSQNTMHPQFSPCGRFVALGGRDGSVVIYELEEFRRQLAKLENR